ncbi:transcriptional activator NhaR [Schlesneria paludicola]|uniref:transcriptional activator NhaR n=1 Tax=Schlesneria paludicola TaxID=360056 RepID=UPI00029B2899|nr:transcriptional activator NhaR [Schlesneria paludicola]
MNQLNFQHLFYFWTVAREGTIAKACKILFLTQPTISAQLRSLEKAAGAKLFERSGRHLVLTETGQTVFRYAEEIFSLSRELQETLSGRPSGRTRKLVVGVADVLPGMIVYRLLEPVLNLPEPVQLVCHDDKTEKLLARLAINELDVVLSDVPASPFVNVRAFNHLLGECAVSFMASADLAAKYRRGFPQSLNGAPFLLPMEGSSLRRSLDQWFDALEIRPMVRGEFGDCDLFEVFGSGGAGVFAVPTVVEQSIQQQHRVELLGRVDSIKERFFAISVEKRLKHPAVVAITDAARQRLFE